ncbi:MAG: coproporphyrinogen dehydrogenase HemZ, partial [Lachnospiraceae bacterium]|nr:coproporphyrinogen dehydrogenase HemZ [Lachnospiraceae bacterium]
LSCDIAQRELRIIGDSKGKYSLYIGIPFCPSICLYCSFSSYPIGLYRNMVQDYVAAVKKEIAFVGEHFADKTLDTVYFGGGTPTSVSAEALDEIITALEEHVDLSHLREFTVEAGRPDSITEEKLRVLLKHHVGRISINPQTMQQKTLDHIGRFHTVEQIRKTYALARRLSDENIAAGGKGFLINMDLIVGLPGESIEDVRDTLAQIETMAPDNLTVHSLAIKRSARLNIEWEKYENILQSADHNIMDEVMASARRMGMEPYYLYRQKQISGNLENIGFAREGDEGIYNILIMEEQEDIVALGAGSACKKILRNPDGSIATDKKAERCENVKDVEQYIARVDEMIARKKELYV